MADELEVRVAPPSREAEIAARLAQLHDIATALEAQVTTPTQRLAFELMRQDERDLRCLLAQLQQARQEQARAAIEFGAEAEAERLKAQALQSSLDHCAQRVLALAAALQQAREALKSIANSSCCTGCQEAALVARAALKGNG